MTKKKMVPELRFKGFTEDWEEKELGKVGETYTGLSGKSKNDFGHGKAKYITYMNVFSNTITSPDLVESIEVDDRQNTVRQGDVFFTTSSETPEEVGMSSVLQSECTNTYLNSFCFGYRPTYLFDHNYLAYMLRSRSIRQEIVFLAQGISRYNISKNRVMEISVPITCIEEQALIGSFLVKLDNLIALHQRKHDKLCMFKKAMLEKMFTKDNTVAPEIRFKNFAGKWNKNPLNFYLDPSTEKNYEGKYNKENVLSVSGEFGIVNQIEFQGRSFAGASVANYGIVHTGDVVYTKSPLKNNPYGIIKANMGKDGIVSTLYAVYKAKKVINSCFVNYYFCSDFRLNCYLKPLVNKGAKNDMKVTSENALLGKVIFPQIIEEQIKIAAFFEKVDSLISLHQRELDKLKHIKQACLEKMFV